MKRKKIIYLICFLAVFGILNSQNPPATFKNPILTGFNPDPSICRVGDDYYLVVSSFVWFPGLPIYHSKDLVNWELIGHGLNRPEMVDFTGLDDDSGIYAPTIRYHNGTFYIITTASKSGGNFYITATNPAGPWSDPVWLKNAPGIDPSLFFDDDGRCYYTGNRYDFKKSWPAQCGIWMQELDLKQGKLVGDYKILTYGHASNAAYTEAPHLYKINGKYLLITAEGGTDAFHSVTVHQSNSLWGPYVSDKVNPVLTHRHLGPDYPIYAVGHADLIETQNGDWYAVVLGKRLIDGKVPLSRETFLCKVDFENGSPIFNKGFGKVRMGQERPNLPWTPKPEIEGKEWFNKENLSSDWYFIRNPQKQFYNFSKNKLNLFLQPETADSLKSAGIIVQKIKHHNFSISTKLSFQTKTSDEQAGIIIYRSANSYYALLKSKSEVILVKKHYGNKEIVGKAPYSKSDIYINVVGNGLDVKFSFGDSENNLTQLGEIQSLAVTSDDSKSNRFNGPGVGVYATSNGKKSKNKAEYEWFEYRENK